MGKSAARSLRLPPIIFRSFGLKIDLIGEDQNRMKPRIAILHLLVVLIVLKTGCHRQETSMKNTDPVPTTTSTRSAATLPDAAPPMPEATPPLSKQVREFKQHRRSVSVDTRNQVNFEGFVTQAGATLKCWFTFEMIASTESRTSALEGVDMVYPNVQSVAELSPG